MTGKKYTYVFDVAFSVDSDSESSDGITYAELIAGLEKRLATLKNEESGTEPFGFVDSSKND